MFREYRSLRSHTGVVPIASQTTARSLYDIDLVIYKGQNDPPLSMPNLRVAACELFLKQGIHVLIGRDVLSRCVLIYNGEHNIFTLAF